jgi:hypothetical protein
VLVLRSAIPYGAGSIWLGTTSSAPLLRVAEYAATGKSAISASDWPAARACTASGSVPNFSMVMPPLPASLHVLSSPPGLSAVPTRKSTCTVPSCTATFLPHRSSAVLIDLGLPFETMMPEPALKYSTKSTACFRSSLAVIADMMTS